MTEIIIAIITAVGTIIAVALTNKSANDKMMQTMKIHQAVTDEKITELTREVRAHNHFAERMPVVEEQIKDFSRRIKDLEQYHKGV